MFVYFDHIIIVIFSPKDSVVHWSDDSSAPQPKSISHLLINKAPICSIKQSKMRNPFEPKYIIIRYWTQVLLEQIELHLHKHGKEGSEHECCRARHALLRSPPIVLWDTRKYLIDNTEILFEVGTFHILLSQTDCLFLLEDLRLFFFLSKIKIRAQGLQCWASKQNGSKTLYRHQKADVLLPSHWQLLSTRRRLHVLDQVRGLFLCRQLCSARSHPHLKRTCRRSWSRYEGCSSCRRGGEELEAMAMRKLGGLEITRPLLAVALVAMVLLLVEMSGTYRGLSPDVLLNATNRGGHLFLFFLLWFYYNYKRGYYFMVHS